MATEQRDNAPRWYVLNHIAPAFLKNAEKVVDRFNSVQNCNLDIFNPTYVVREERNGEVCMRTVNLTFHYVFVRGTFAQIKLLCSQDNGFSFLLDRGSESKYAVISDRDMAGFKTIARAYGNFLPYFSLDDIDLEDGDLVEVVNGDFPGLVGIYMPKAKSKSGNIVLNVFNNVGTIAFDVKADDIRILEFSTKSTRVNDQIDAFVPHLLSALRLYHADEPMPASLIAKLTVFARRMEVARLGNRKLNAKLQALLFAANHILGNIEAASAARARYDQLATSVTNEWTKALIALIYAIADGTPENLSSVTLTPTSKSQTAVAEEYRHYLALLAPRCATSC